MVTQAVCSKKRCKACHRGGPIARGSHRGCRAPARRRMRARASAAPGRFPGRFVARRRGRAATAGCRAGCVPHRRAPGRRRTAQPEQFRLACALQCGERLSFQAGCPDGALCGQGATGRREGACRAGTIPLVPGLSVRDAGQSGRQDGASAGCHRAVACGDGGAGRGVCSARCLRGGDLFSDLALSAI